MWTVVLTELLRVTGQLPFPRAIPFPAKLTDSAAGASLNKQQTLHETPNERKFCCLLRLDPTSPLIAAKESILTLTRSTRLEH